MSNNATPNKEPVIQVRNLKKWFPRNKNIFGVPEYYVRAVDDVSFEVYKGEIFSIVGESGCGKSTLCKLIVRLMEPDAGDIIYKGVNISKMKEKEMRRLRKNLQMIFQDPFASLDPRMTVGDIIIEPLDVQKPLRGKERYEKITELLQLCGLDPAYANRYPHEFSGGQRQRIGIARALSVSPEIILCDEPLSALDVSIQSQIINLLTDLQKKLGLTLIFVSHDLNVVYQISDRIMVMYLGKVVELGTCDDIYRNTLHPYTKALIDAIPAFHGGLLEKEIIQGDITSHGELTEGCPFSKRCRYCQDICRKTSPKLVDYGGGHFAACHFADKLNLLEGKNED